MTTTLPEIEIVELFDLDDAVPCLARPVTGCPIPATWRVSITCPGCGDRDSATICDPHARDLWRKWHLYYTACCETEPVDVVWRRL